MVDLAASQTSYKATGLTAGKTYEFRVQSLNSYGYSADSSVLSLLCAFIPDSPLTVATQNIDDKVKIIWSEPINNGSPITAYKLFIEQNDHQTYTEETIECQGSTSTVVTARVCSLSLETLKAAPYSLIKGDSVIAQIKSVNFYGESLQVVTGNGAVIRDVPDAPKSLQNDLGTSSDTLIRFTWSDGTSDGGTPVLDYIVLYD